ncbi:hypothetical protein VTN49DRAFT_1882 [Thermomyces lanuginosus]|uniref:uncharacterized protein n=1 Tax=Thermomyces lanuginosus TaxID=5541 RepID=UPI0037426C36
MATNPHDGGVHYTVFVRLPFPRGDFIDPPPVNWNAAKDRALWEILSRPTKGDDIDWKAIAEEFDVTLPFLLQQVAWLYDRQLSQVRAQMRRVGTTHSASPSPGVGSVAGSGTLGGQPMRRVGSGGSRGLSKLSALAKETPTGRAEDTPVSATKARAPSVRTSSANTVTQIQGATEASSTPPMTPKEDYPSQRPTSRRERPSLAVLQKAPKAKEKSPPLSESDESETESDSEDDMLNRRIGGGHRFGKFSIQKPALRSNEDDEDESPAFLPLSSEPQASGRDLNSTLRQGDQTLNTIGRRDSAHPASSRQSSQQASSLNSSESSGVAVTSPQIGPTRRSGPLSPQRVGDLARRSPRRPGSATHSSENTSSMGSSFSDLDDASVTQSALEEALLSNMQHGGMASRMSTISQALRSRYL